MGETEMTKLEIEDKCEKLISASPDKVNNFKFGKHGILGWFVGKLLIDNDKMEFKELKYARDYFKKLLAK